MSGVVLSTREVALLMNVTETTIKRWADENAIVCARTFGGHRKFQLRDVIEFAERHHYPLVGLAPRSVEDQDREMLDFALQTRNFGKLSAFFLKQALVADRNAMYELLSYIAKHHISLPAIGDEIIKPAMVRIGEMWKEGNLEVYQEHGASQSILDALIRLAPDLHRKTSNGLSALCACVEGNHHEIGLKILSYALEAEGWSVRYLGADTPFETIRAFMKAAAPQLVCLSAASHRIGKEHFEEFRKTGKCAATIDAACIVGGPVAAHARAEELFCDALTGSIHDAISFVKERFQLKPGPRKKQHTR